ncbi:helix-turn-helix transcriptional regulator [Sphingomonas sabuli]|uniref:Helix-turn-helix transcriptional regulator n=1 Tax=Sphingomonas sabuli TaxID=2764186 RepID=A0A7G9KZV0_9SPHN|nr:helix-turn-helix domain-containing protein [Sphingomonas sabuli]QNM81899.1 helix-turn-helix transcriptional regulator [Sphingomonas sabuli]
MSTRPTLGQILKELRRHRNWTLRDMSEHSGIPLSTLSKVENDRLTLTYDKLVQLSENLEIPISELFAETEPPETVTARRSIGRLEDAIRVNTPNYDYYYLCTELRHKRMVPILTRIRAKTLSEFGDLVSHNGEEYIHVLEGSIIVHTEFYDPVTLQTGEAIYIDSKMGHAYLAAEGCDEALVLGVCSSEDEALLSSLMHMHEPVPELVEASGVAPPKVRALRRPAI